MVAGVKLELGQHLSPLTMEAIILGTYEEEEIAILDRRLAPGDVVVELGAGIGFLSTYCAKRIGSERVFAFEANPALEAPIRRTWELNGVQPQLEMCAVGRERGEVSFYVERDFWSSSRVRRSRRARTIRVPMRSVDEVLQGVEATFLIVDIEGGEVDVVESLVHQSLRRLLIEWHPHIIGRSRVEELQALLFSRGFSERESHETKSVALYERRELLWDQHL